MVSDQDMLKFKIYDIIRKDNRSSSTEIIPEKLVLGLCSALKVLFLNMIGSVSSRKGSKVSPNEVEAIGRAMCQNEREAYGRPADHRWIFASID